MRHSQYSKKGVISAVFAVAERAQRTAASEKTHANRKNNTTEQTT